MEDHGGKLKLDNRPEGGAVTSLVFQATQDTSKGTVHEIEDKMVSHGA